MNKLVGSTSPYLLQHVANPVAWEPWGPEALERSRREGKPIFLSVGYSACHWCHVMAHESFEDPATAAVLNESFVNIKVDREERPDLDAVYMAAVQLLTGRGGWPMSVFLTPGLEPFFAGTYWPPEPRHGMPAFGQVIAAVIAAWRQRPEDVAKQAAEITAALVRPTVATAGPPPDASILEAAAAALARSYEPAFGGFGSAPKFPHAMDLRLLLRTCRRSGRLQDLEMVTHTLSCMAAGGIHDQLGGGFSRYSVDDRWLVPHFEKMLYDNALLATVALETFLVTGREEFEAVVRSTLDYVLRDLTDPAGGFWSAEDADSEGEEGRFYVWTPAEIANLLAPSDAALVCEAYGVIEQGTFEGRSILHLREPLAAMARRHRSDPAEVADRLRRARATLFAARSKRVRPGSDDKVLVAWNGLAIDALARAGAALDERRYLAAAGRAAAFLLTEVRDAQGRLAHQWRRGLAGGLAFADDLACLAEGLVSLYEATFDERWITEACELADRLIGTAGFIDAETGGVFQASLDHERLIVRQPDLLDNAAPGSTGMTATVLMRLAALTGRDDYRLTAERAVAAAMAVAARAPGAVPQSLVALDMLLGPFEENVVVGDPGAPATRDLLRAIRRQFRPQAVLALRPPVAVAGPLDALFEGRQGTAGDATLFRCIDRVCLPPVTGAAAVAAAVDRSPA